MSWDGAATAITTALSGITNPVFQAVVNARPLAVPHDAYLCWWYEGDEEQQTTLTNSMIAERCKVAALWRIQESLQLRQAQEREIQTAVRAIKAALRGDSALGGNAQDLHVGNAVVSVEDIGGNRYLAAIVPFEVLNLEAETIVP